MRALNTEILDRLKGNGADLVGFADVTCLPVDVTDGLPRAISIAVALDPAAIRDIKDGPTAKYFAEYDRANTLLGRRGEQIARLLIEAGYQARPFPATTEQIDRTTLSVKLQHKTVATRAGLGWIGKSGLLVTKEYGSAVRLASVLTDAALEIGTPTDASHCGDCRQCVAHCPAQAITGQDWEPGLSREHIYSAAACLKMAREFAGRTGIKATICGICINVCPWTQRYLARELKESEPWIAPATAEDLGAVKELFREYEASLPFDLSFQDFERELAGLPGRYAPPSGQLLLARCDGAFVGCVALRHIGEGLCEMKRLFVQPAFQGKGIGKALAQAVIEEGRRIGYKRMRLDTVLEPAKSLYRSLGFREIPPYQHVPVEGVVFMELEL
jgi:epoxyqueuosine reductase QueG/predicted GNAT family acetyltransferase